MNTRADALSVVETGSSTIARGRWTCHAACLIALGSLLATPVAHADGTADEADLQFRMGAHDFQRGEFEGALAHFMASNRVAPNRNVVFNIAITFEQLLRFSDAYRYYVDALQGETDPATVTALHVALDRLAPKVAILDIVTEPPGATLYLDRRELGSAGHGPRPIAVTPGPHRVIAELEGYRLQTSDEVQATIGTTQKVKLRLVRILGTIHVETSRPAEVRIDGQTGAAACTAPCDLELPPGMHELTFAAEGFTAPPRAVSVVADERTVVSTTLQPQTGSLVVRSDEPGALVAVDGKPSGFTPAVIPDVPAGRREVTVSLRGYSSVAEPVTVLPNQQSEPPEVPLVPLREVVAVSRREEQTDDAPSSLTVITGEEIRAFGYPTIADALTGVRGFTISNDGAYASASVRGLGQPEDYGNRLLVLADGQSLNDNIDNSSAIGSNARVDLGDISRIEVVRGPGSLLYGTGALSGVVNIVGRDRDEPSQVEVGLGEYGDSVLHGRGEFHYNVSSDMGIWASASGAHSGGVDLAIPVTQAGGGTLNETAGEVNAFRGANTEGRAWWGPLTVQWFYNQHDQVVPLGAYGTPFGNSNTTLDDSRAMAEVRYEPHLSSTVDLLLRFHANHSSSIENFASDSDTPSTETYLGTWFGTEARLVWHPLTWLSLTGGGEGQYDPVASMTGLSANPGAASTTYLKESDPYGFGAGYVLAEATPHPKIHIQLGARVDDYSTFGAIFVPRATVVIKPIEGGTLKILGGRAFRAPSVYEQFYNDGAVTQARAVDPSRGLTLGPESYYSGEIEYAQRFKQDWVALASVYDGQVTGLITTVPDTAGSSVIRFANSPSPVHLYGVDAELRREFRHGWMLSAAYSFERAEYTQPINGDSTLVNAPENQASLKGVVPLIHDLLNLAMRATLEAPRRINLDGATYTQGAVVMDVVASGLIRDFGLRYRLGLYNLANQQYQVPISTTFASPTMPQSGRTVLFDLTETFQ